MADKNITDSKKAVLENIAPAQKVGGVRRASHHDYHDHKTAANGKEEAVREEENEEASEKEEIEKIKVLRQTLVQEQESRDFNLPKNSTSNVKNVVNPKQQPRSMNH